MYHFIEKKKTFPQTTISGRKYFQITIQKYAKNTNKTKLIKFYKKFGLTFRFVGKGWGWRGQATVVVMETLLVQWVGGGIRGRHDDETRRSRP
jgi:hypothetical protein